MAPPARSLSVADGRTGVWRATSPMAARARATSSAVTVIASPGSATTASISTCAPFGSAATPIATRAGGSAWKYCGVGLVDLGERAQIGHVDREPHGVVERRAGGGADGLEVVQAADGLLGGRLADQLAAVGIERDLARAEQEPGGGRRRGCMARWRPGLRRRSRAGDGATWIGTLP